MTTTFVHYRRCPFTDLNVIASAFKLDQQIGVFVGASRAAELDATEVVGGTVLADVLVCGAIGAVIVGGDFRKESEHDPVPIRSEDDDCVHLLALSREQTGVAGSVGEEITLPSQNVRSAIAVSTSQPSK